MLNMSKTTYKHLLHHVVDLCCVLVSIGLLIWLIVGPGYSGGLAVTNTIWSENFLG